MKHKETLLAFAEFLKVHGIKGIRVFQIRTPKKTPASMTRSSERPPATSTPTGGTFKIGMQGLPDLWNSVCTVMPGITHDSCDSTITVEKERRGVSSRTTVTANAQRHHDRTPVLKSKSFAKKKLKEKPIFRRREPVLQIDQEAAATATRSGGAC